MLQRSARYVLKTDVPLPELSIGESARIAYKYSKDDQQLHQLDGLQERPGSTVKLHQAYPSYVIECEGASIALDKQVAANIHIWMPNHEPLDECLVAPHPPRQKRHVRRLGLRHRSRAPQG